MLCSGVTLLGAAGRVDSERWLSPALLPVSRLPDGWTLTREVLKISRRWLDVHPWLFTHRWVWNTLELWRASAVATTIMNYAPKIVRAAAHSVLLYLTPVSYSAGNKRKYWNHCKECLTIHGQDKARVGVNFMIPSRRNSKRNKMFALSNKVDEINDAG